MKNNKGQKMITIEPHELDEYQDYIRDIKIIYKIDVKEVLEHLKDSYDVVFELFEGNSSIPPWLSIGSNDFSFTLLLNLARDLKKIGYKIIAHEFYEANKHGWDYVDVDIERISNNFEVAELRFEIEED